MADGFAASPSPWLRNSWYVAGWSRDLGDRPMAVRMLGEPIAVYRTQNGVAALRDRCPHRQAPLSLGKVVGNQLQCGYHGLTFDPAGRCVEAPCQPEPPNVSVRAYPAVERHGWIWLWMGDPALADPGTVPDFHWFDDQAYATVGKTNHVACAYKLVTDNLLDLSHVGYIHTSTIGTPEFGRKGELTVKRTDRGVRVTRLVPDVPPPPTYVMSGVLPAGRNIDRWQIIDFIAPSFVVIHVGGAEVGTGALEGRYGHGLNLWVLNAMTPETETTTNYHWGSARSHALGDPQADTLFFNQVSLAFEEDKIMLEAQQATMLADDWSCALKEDAGSIQARRVLERLIAREAEMAERLLTVA